MRIISRYFKSFLIFFLAANFSYAQEELKTRKVTLYGTAIPLAINTYNLEKGDALPMKEAGYNPKNIHLGYLYGNINKSTLLAPASGAYTTFNNNITEMITSWGKDRNDGVFINISNELAAIKTYNSVETNADIEKLYFDKLEQISGIEGYNKNKNGPGDKLVEISLGDIIIFKSDALEPYYIFQVKKLKPGHAGEIELEVKGIAIDKKSKKKKK